MFKTKTDASAITLLNHTEKDGLIICRLKRDTRSDSMLDYNLLKSHYRNLEAKQKIGKTDKRSHVFKIKWKGKEYSVRKNNNQYSREEVSMAMYNNIKKNGKPVCEYCRKDMTVNSMSLDHFIPKAFGGKNSPNNYRVSCYRCNSVKGAIDPYKNKGIYNLFLKYIEKRDVSNSGSDFYCFLKTYVNKKFYLKYLVDHVLNFSLTERRRIYELDSLGESYEVYIAGKLSTK